MLLKLKQRKLYLFLCFFGLDTDYKNSKKKLHSDDFTKITPEMSSNLSGKDKHQ